MNHKDHTYDAWYQALLHDRIEQVQLCCLRTMRSSRTNPAGLHEVAAHSNLSILEWLLTMTNPNQIDNAGWTPLMTALMWRQDFAVHRMVSVTKLMATNDMGDSESEVARLNKASTVIQNYLNDEARRQEVTALRHIEEAIGASTKALSRSRLQGSGLLTL